MVRRIYALAIEGKGAAQIARMLYEEKVERPTYYQLTHGIVKAVNYDHSDPYAWRSSTVGNILSKPEYMGHTVNFRTYKDSYKDKQKKWRPKEDWLIFENTHPAIIDPETWETAQRRRKTVRRTDNGEANPLTGLLFCADCGAKMYNHRVTKAKHYICQATGKPAVRNPIDAYDCSTYKLTGRLSDAHCTPHHINTKVVRELVLDAIKTVSGYAKTNEAEFIKRARAESLLQHEQAAKTHRKRITKEQRRVEELNVLIKRIYEDYVAEKLNEKRFETMLAEYEKEQATLEESVAQLQAELDSYGADSARVDQFMALAKRYTDFTELTPMMIGEFIEKIVVHEADRPSGEREQEVDIYLNFIGKFDVPVPKPTPEEIAATEKAKLQRAKRREYSRRYREKQIQKHLAEQKTARELAEKKTA